MTEHVPGCVYVCVSEVWREMGGTELPHGTSMAGEKQCNIKGLRETKPGAKCVCVGGYRLEKE